jgi:hypothetical protein
VYAAKIANEIIGVRTGAAFAIELGIELARVVGTAGEIKRASPERHALWA